MKIHVVGSGPSALHFARRALDNGHRVVMLDVGHPAPDHVAPDLSWARLKAELEDPGEYFLGSDFRAVLFPDNSDEYYGFPPHKDYVFEGVPHFAWKASGFAPLFSFAQGGLAQAWTGGSFPFSDQELEDFPFGYAELGPYYDEVAKCIGVNGADDDLAPYVPVHANLMEPLPLDEHAANLYGKYERHRQAFRERHRAAIGRTRSATITRDYDGRTGCGKLGRCLWGCPTDSLYTPIVTLRRLKEHPEFEYLPNRYVQHFELANGRATRVVARRTDTDEIEEHEVESLVLGAGTLSSCGIFLESKRRSGGDVPRLTGLMDNRQVLMPFVNLAMVRRPFEPDSFQYHQLSLGIEGEVPKEYVHGLVTTLKTALIHPIVQNVPFDLRTALFIFKNAHAALGIVNVNLHDDRRDSSYVTLEDESGEGTPRLRIHYEPSPREPDNLRRALGTTKKLLRKLGCIVPPGMMHVRPMGASVHYAGLLPMTDDDRPLTTTPQCRSRDVENLWFVDATTFPFLPAKNLTFSLMANAVRVADGIGT